MPDPRYKSPDAAILVVHGRGHCEAPAPALVAASIVTALGIMLLLRSHGGDPMFVTSPSGDLVAGGASGAAGQGSAWKPSRKSLVASSRQLVGGPPRLKPSDPHLACSAEMSAI